MIDIENETLILPREVCRMFPGRSGKGIALCTAWRWMLKGRKGHKLESLIVGGQRYTSREAVCRFAVACNGERVNRHGQSPEHHGRNTERLERALQAEGF